MPQSRTAPIKTEKPWLRFWGVRGSIPTPGPGTVRYGGNTSCIEVRADGEIIILDGGTGLRALGKHLTTEFLDRELQITVLLTHTHWDHIQGLPFFLPVFRPQSRVRIIGYEGARLSLKSVLTGQMESPFFPIGLREVPANVEIQEMKGDSFKIGKVRVEACLANHPGMCMGYRLFTSGGSVGYFPDNEPHYGHLHAPLASTAGDTTRVEYARNEDKKMFAFLDNADALIMDSQYDAAEYKTHRGWGHACIDQTVQFAMQAKVKHLYLFHHDPEHDDAKLDSMLAYARRLVADKKSKILVSAAMEGMKVSF
jgi:phosphoribosyl 1,2-cyclic phosphodiesterase